MFSWLPVLARAEHTESAPGNFQPHAIQAGPFQPNWDSLAAGYETPEWFRDAKFGIWAHWGAQCEPEDGDWYARNMYIQGSKQNIYQVEHYGPPSQVGFKDIIHLWKAEKFDPEELMALYKKAGAKYFMALANHHDNFDNFASKYQPWNATAEGPKKDLIGMWAKAAHHQGLRFAVSVHASHAWSWYEPAQGSDKTGPLAGVPYDGNITKADGKGKWWDGLDPQELYSQRHPVGSKLEWTWDPAKGSSTPDAAYCEKFFLRTKQLWDDYKPDMIYFDDTVLPLYGVSDALGLELVAHFYNSSINRFGHNEAVVNGKKLDEVQRRAITYDIERGKASEILPQPWQTDTCIGDWHYDRNVYNTHSYKSAGTVVPMLVDIVSKNGNLMLNIPVRADGTIDDDERKIVGDIGVWMKVNSEAIFATRPWKVYGEGPSTVTAESGQFGGQRDTQKQPFTAQDVRFTQSKDHRTVYAIVLGWPADGRVLLKSMAGAKPRAVHLLGVRRALQATPTPEGLAVTLPSTKPCDYAYALKLDI